MRALISGASIAGPALAHWLAIDGHDVTVVERADRVRQGGQAVDFKGITHRTVLERMGILEDIRRARLPRGGDGIVVDATGRRIAAIPAEFAAGEIEIARGDLARILYERTASTCRYVFDDSVTSLVQTDSGVDVGFERSAPETYDLVVGADGIHSNVRRLAFGPDDGFVQYLGYYYALASIDSDSVRDDLMYNEPGRMVATGGVKAPAFFVFASRELPSDRRDDLDRQKQLLIDAYAGSAWKVPQILSDLVGAKEFYMDSISRVTADRYAEGRVVLLGDAAYGNALGGFGTGLAIVGAYVLAGELKRAAGDHLAAYAAYESKFRGYANVSRKVNAGRLLAPATRLGLYARNRIFSAAPLFKGVMKLMDHFATDIELDDYGRDASSPPAR